MATIIEELSNQVQDELPMVVHEAFRGLDPIYQHIDQTSIDVVSADTANMGYKWQINHLFSGGLAGLIQNADPLGPAIDDATQYEKSLKFIDASDAGVTPFPTALEAPNAGVIKRTLALHMNTGNFPVPVAWLQHDKLSAAHVKQCAMNIKALGQLRALMESISFYCDKQGGYPVLGRVADEVGTITAVDTNKGYTFGVDGGRIAYFRPGMMVDIYTDAGAGSIPGTKVNSTSQLVISRVDFINKTITVTGAGAFSNTDISAEIPSDDDWILWKGCTTQYRPLVSWGIEDWVKSSGYLFQSGASTGFNLTSYPHFASQVVAVSNALTDTVLNGYVGGFIDAYGDAAPDTILTTWGATLKYIQAPNASGLDRMLFDRTGKALKVNGGFSDVEFTFNGRNMNWMISSMVLPGYLYGLRLGDGNIKRYVPPKVGGSDDRIGQEVEFLAPVGGHNGIFKIAHNGDGASLSVLEAPFWQYRLIAPMDVRSIKLTGLTEATMG
jgi:hypothetical protein